ncbi:MAG: hypothetical protein CMK09_17620 [Ponticaulis sp.]|nr:hypothetical protein [Ponticaulis sp.]|tara:strand:+ start:21541 stop:21915 length:375 start_codon:yes stop_codon:yes gene_type:complete
MNDRLPTSLWVDALVRRVSLGGASAFVVSRGDRERGDVVVKVNSLDGRAALLVPSPLMSESRSFDWLPVPGKLVPDDEVEELVRRRRSYDPDLWVIEIEDKQARHFLTETVNSEQLAPDDRTNS